MTLQVRKGENHRPAPSCAELARTSRPLCQRRWRRRQKQDSRIIDALVKAGQLTENDLRIRRQCRRRSRADGEAPPCATRRISPSLPAQIVPDEDTAHGFHHLLADWAERARNAHRLCPFDSPELTELVAAAPKLRYGEGPATLIEGNTTTRSISWSRWLRSSSTASAARAEIQRYKGLGEMTAEQLWETTMDRPNGRSSRFTPTISTKPSGSSSMLMGEAVEPRREFIDQHA